MPGVARTLRAVRFAFAVSVATIVGAGVLPVVLGGDHGTTLPVLRALAKRHGTLISPCGGSPC